MGCLFQAHIENIPDCNLTDGQIERVWKGDPKGGNTFTDKVPKDNETINGNFINVYPNPSTGDVTLEIRKAGKYLVYNQIGQIVKEISVENDKISIINLENLALGLYFVKSTTNNTSHKTFVVNY